MQILEHAETINMIEHLNLFIEEEIGTNVQGEHGLYFTYVTIGYIDIIKFAEFQIWNSEDDERYYNEDKDEYEPLEEF